MNVKKNIIIPYIYFLICSLIACVIFDVYRSFYQNLSFEEVFYRNPFEACRVLIGYKYDDIYYGGLTNFLAGIFHYFLYGLLIGGLVGAGIYFLLNKYLFKNRYEPDIWGGLANRSRVIFFVFLFFVGPIYDFVSYSFYSLTIENYSCEFLIKTIQNSW